MRHNQKNHEKKSIWDVLRFDKAQQEFELLEVEKGSPYFFGGKQKLSRAEGEQPEAPKQTSASLAENEQRVRDDFHVEINPDILLRRFALGGKVQALAVCVTGMVANIQVNDFILRQGMQPGCMDGSAEGTLAQYAVERVFAQQEAALSANWDEIKTAILEGRTAVFLEGDDKVVLMETRGFVSRGVETAQNEQVIRGPKEGFNENLRTNITLLRRIIKTEDFICEFRSSGGRNNVRLCLAYRADIVNPSLLAEVKKRLDQVEARMLLSDGTIEQLTERSWFSPIPQVLSTERPDRTAAHIMQGHVAILLEGSPSASVMPATFFTLMSTSEDAYLRRPLSTIMRAVRYIGAGLSVLLPGYFLAIALHHQGMIDTEVLATIIASRQMVFLPLGLEMLFLLWVFQLLREAGIRVPGGIGQAIGIIGGLILGQAAVAANMVSTVVLIVVALAGLGNFTIPDYSTQIAASYFRVFLLVAGWLGGLLGFAAGIVLLVAWLASLKSYGVPFLAPVAPKTNGSRPPITRGNASKKKQNIVDYTNMREEAP